MATRQLAVCATLRQTSHVARTLRTADYADAARTHLGKEITKARLAAGYKWRTVFAAAAGISTRSVTAAETGEPTVGQATLYAIGRTLPHWTEDTPRVILEGGAAPPTMDSGPRLPQMANVPEDPRKEELRTAFRLYRDELGSEAALQWLREQVAQENEHRRSARMPDLI